MYHRGTKKYFFYPAHSRIEKISRLLSFSIYEIIFNKFANEVSKFMGKSLVIVESPAKAKTINKMLGPRYAVVASMGHVRDLPKSRMGIDIENGFTPRYTTPARSRKLISQLKKAADGAERIFLAPDPDREGEAIAWHLEQVLSPSGKEIYRVAFNEITKKAVTDAFSRPGRVDMNKVESQQARRILDRIVGYRLSPLLWKKVGRGLSAGRVQSVAVRLICDREAEIRAFTPEEYWTIEGIFEKRGESSARFAAALVKIDGRKPEIASGEEAARIAAEASALSYSVSSVKEREQRQRPLPPFITSTLQQAGVNKLRWPIAKTMKIAQQLYEGLDIGEKGAVGLITYMRTDSFRITPAAQKEARSFIKETFGSRYVPERPVSYRSRKGAQEAHEAIRPTSVRRTPEEVKRYLDRDQLALYSLIWTRFVASQMAPAVLKKIRVEMETPPFLFRATDTRIVFPGHLAVSGVPVKGEGEKELPPLAVGDPLELVACEPSQHFTAPPPRYTEATLVREMEEKGIGRPSTYAPTIATIRKRGYVRKEKGRLHPTPLGELVNNLLVRGFPKLIAVDFTADLENRLDAIENGKARRIEVLRDFYEAFTRALESASKNIKSVKKEAELTSAVCEKCGSPMVIRHTIRGSFLACSAFPKCRNTKRITIKEDGSFTIEKPVLLEEKCPRCGRPLMEKHGRFGRFVACSGYPGCRYVKPRTTGVKCPRPDCEGEIVVKRAKGRFRFYGCSNYPDCRFTAKSLEEIEAAAQGGSGAQ